MEPALRPMKTAAPARTLAHTGCSNVAAKVLKTYMAKSGLPPLTKNTLADSSKLETLLIAPSGRAWAPCNNSMKLRLPASDMSRTADCNWRMPTFKSVVAYLSNKLNLCTCAGMKPSDSNPPCLPDIQST
eukprot:CAMPEP_0198581110 /NCGR_PEP_ID=MMETSP1462-20131121/123803_1 /TAXON_ID=1333877 /ORGANISM="Brandtodinium nutriculum, Strain RCC3387" /LENGTH=129 /DNA_ID=CAMNT_0044312479 /DNA_START=136 /DNA_END=521 /DNA_ORIENTATION=-